MYVWLINTIYRAKRISYKDLNERWKRDDGMSGVQELPKRTLKRWLNIIEVLLGIDIKKERCGGYRYYIENIEGIDEGELGKLDLQELFERYREEFRCVAALTEVILPAMVQ